jgi:hypothetical protein
MSLIIINKKNVDPILELYRGKIYCNILNNFIFVCTKHLGKEIFSIKKSYQRTLTNLLSSWMFNLYSFSNLSIENYNIIFNDNKYIKKDHQDAFIPDNYDDISILKITLLDFCKYNNDVKDYEEIINNILDEFISFFEKQILILENYKKSGFYINQRSNYKISKKEISQVRNNKNITFYKFLINVNFGINNEKLENIINNILLPLDVYNKLKNNFTGNIKLIDDYIWSIIFRYQLLSSNNHQLGILPSIINNMQVDYNLSFECFASSINCTLKNYCSIYYDLEHLFGSHGNFFNKNFIEGVYTFNPPYQKNIIDKGYIKINYHLDLAHKNDKELTFILTIPVWDKEGQKIINHSNKIDYGEFEVINKIKESIFFRGLRIISKEEFTYIDHNFKLLKNKTIQNTYIILLSSKETNFEKMNSYNFYE